MHHAFRSRSHKGASRAFGSDLSISIDYFSIDSFFFRTGKSKIDIGRQKFERFEFNENSNNRYPNSMLTLHNLTKFDDENTITCEARNQVENVWRETDVTEVLRVDGELIKFSMPLNCDGNRCQTGEIIWRSPLKTNWKSSAATSVRGPIAGGVYYTHRVLLALESTKTAVVLLG